jgi:hypothetical protein
MVRNKARESNNMISAEKSAGRGFNSHSRLHTPPIPLQIQELRISSRRGRADFESIWVQYRRYPLDRNTLRVWNCEFYRELRQKGISVRVGLEATGYSRWFERLLAELGIEVWIGDAAEIKAKRVRKQKTDRPLHRLS